MDFKDLTPEQQERARNANDPKEVLAFAKEAGYELSDEELEGISGGGWGDCDELCRIYRRAAGTTSIASAD